VSQVSLAAASGFQRVTVRPVVPVRALTRVHFVVRRPWRTAPPAQSPTVVRRPR